MADRRRPAAALAAVGIFFCARFFSTTPESQAFTGTSAVTAASCQRQCGITLNAVDKAMVDRMASISKTAKLTDAMRLVSTAKVRRAQEGSARSRPFSQELTSMIKGIVKKVKGSGLEKEIPMLRVPASTKKVGLVLISSSRGLCGAYNTFIIKKAKKRIQDLNAQGIVPKLTIIGRKGNTATKYRLAGLEFDYKFGSFFPMPEKITAAISSKIAEEIANSFLSGEVDKVEILYTKFINLITSEPTVRTLLPLSPTGIEDAMDETFALTTVEGKLKVDRGVTEKSKTKDIENDVIFDQEPGTILNAMLPLYLNSQMLSILFESQASELANRMTAMQAATDNAKEINKKLKTAYNRKRQAGITSELCEICSAASCLKKLTENNAEFSEAEDTDTLMEELTSYLQ